MAGEWRTLIDTPQTPLRMGLLLVLIVTSWSLNAVTSWHRFEASITDMREEEKNKCSEWKFELDVEMCLRLGRESGDDGWRGSRWVYHTTGLVVALNTGGGGGGVIWIFNFNLFSSASAFIKEYTTKWEVQFQNHFITSNSKIKKKYDIYFDIWFFS